MPDSGSEDERDEQTMSLTSSGITLLSVVLSIGVTVAVGVKLPWWGRVVVGMGVCAVLLVVVKLGSDSGRGPLARFAKWVLYG